MARIAGVEIPSQKPLYVSLTYIYGIGDKLARDICQKAGVDCCVRVHMLDATTINRIREILEHEYVVEGKLRQSVKENIDRHKRLGTYRGRRHSMNLPVHGQRTRSNARTRRRGGGGRRLPIAAKKLPSKK